MNLYEVRIPDIDGWPSTRAGFFLHQEHASKYAQHGGEVYPHRLIDYDKAQQELDDKKLREETLKSLTPQQRKVLGL